MALFSLIVVTLISTIAVKVGTVALMMTGLERRKASFQALSAFTNAGWTTRETELLMAHDQRRRIITILLVLGHAGLASVVATLISTLGQRGVTNVAIKLAILAGAILVIFLLARWRGLDRRFTAEIKKRLRQTTDLRVTSFEEILHLADGYGVVEVYVSERADIAYKTIGELRLGTRGMAVMAVERNGQIIPAPDSQTELLPGDRLICYGITKSIGGIADELAVKQLESA